MLARIQNLPDEATLYIPVVAQAELLVGIELAADEERKQYLRILYSQVVVEATEISSITTQVAEQYARIFVELQRKGKPIPINDIWIIAIALAIDCILVSSDEHFQFIDGLQV